MQKSILALLTLSIITANGIPIFYNTDITNKYANGNYINCNDNHNYYTVTTIKNYSILYTINKTRSDYIENPTLSIMETLIHTNYNITFHAILDIDYNLLSSCLYKCKLAINTTEKDSHFVAKHFSSLFRIGGYLHMICNSTGCNLGKLRCDTYDYHDEL